MSSIGYVKLFEKILDSTIWLETDQTRIVWITLLAMSSEGGLVDAPIPAIAARARVDVDSCRKAMDSFQRPDPDSRTADFEGRRIEKREGGWFLLNHAKYRALMSWEQRREYKRVKAQEYRERDKSKAASRNNGNHEISSAAEKPASRFRKAVEKEGPSENVLAIKNQKELERVEARLKGVKGQCSADAFGIHPDEMQSEELKGLRNRRDELKKALNFVA